MRQADRNVRPTFKPASSLLGLGPGPAVLFSNVNWRIYPESCRATNPSLVGLRFFLARGVNQPAVTRSRRLSRFRRTVAAYTNLDSSFFGDVTSSLCLLIKAIRLRITRILQATERERKKCPS